MSGRFVKSSWASDDVVESGELTSELRASFLKLKSNFFGGEKPVTFIVVKSTCPCQEAHQRWERCTGRGAYSSARTPKET